MLTRQEYKVLKKYMTSISLVRTNSEISNDYFVGIKNSDISLKEIQSIKRLILLTDKSNNLIFLPKEANQWIIQYRDNSFKRNISVIALVFSVVSIILSFIL